jgi:hypothetical protein
VGILATGVAVKSRIGCVTIARAEPNESWAAPEAEAIAFLRDNQLQGRLLTYFDYGELAIWHLAPKLRVSYDGRRETVYSEAVVKVNLQFYSNAPDVGFARRLEADYIWLPHGLPVVALLERDGWHPMFRGPRSIVLARVPGAFTQPAPWEGQRCFPGP